MSKLPGINHLDAVRALEDELALGDANPPCRIGGCDRNDSGDRFAIAGNNELCFLTGGDLVDQFGKMRLGLKEIDRLHGS